MWRPSSNLFVPRKFLRFGLLTTALPLMLGVMTATAVAKDKTSKEETKSQTVSAEKKATNKAKKLKPKFPKRKVISKNQKVLRKAPNVQGIPRAPNTDNVLQKVPSIVSKPPLRGGIDTRNLTRGKLPRSPSLNDQQPAQKTGSKSIPGRRQSGLREQAAERFLKRNSQEGDATRSTSQQQKFPGAKDLATNGNSSGQAAGPSKIGVGRKLSRKKPKVDGNRDDFITDGASVSDGENIPFRHRRRAGRTVAPRALTPQKKKKSKQVGAGEAETGGEDEGESKDKKKKNVGVSQPVPGETNVRGRAKAEKVKSQLGIKRSKNAPIDPSRHPNTFDPGPIDKRFIPKKSDLAQPVPGEESGGQRDKREKNFGSSTGVFGTGAIDPGPGGN